MSVASPFDAVDLGALPPPDVIETLSYEAILDAMKADFAARWPQFDAWVESDPALKLLEVAAWRELLWRQRVNDAARAVMLATATGADLDHLAALMSVSRRVIDPGDATAVPPVARVLEDDAQLRRRVQLALEAATNAGTAGRYVFFALGAHPDVADAAATSPAPGEVVVTVLGRAADGAPSADALAAVEAAVTDPAVRQLCDAVTVAPAATIAVDIDATLTLAPGPGQPAALAAAQAAAAALFEGRRLGRGLALSRLYAALHVEGVAAVSLTAPVADVVIAETAAMTAGAIAVAAS